MKVDQKTKIIVETLVKVPVEKAWELWTGPEHIVRWNQASADWHTPRAENDLRPGGRFCSRMEARDGSAGFDFWGVYDAVVKFKRIAFTMGDGRKVEIGFTRLGADTGITESFEAESENTALRQRQGWQAILDSFKKYADSG